MQNKFDLDFSKNFRILLASKGLTQSEFCKASGINPATVSRWMTGKGGPTKTTASVVASTLGVSVESLFKPQKSPITSSGINFSVSADQLLGKTEKIEAEIPAALLAAAEKAAAEEGISVDRFIARALLRQFGQ